MAKMTLEVTPLLLEVFPQFGWRRIPRKLKKRLKNQLTQLAIKATREFLDKENGR